jgi:hypothetical protein
MPLQAIGFVFQFLAGLPALLLRTHPEKADKYKTHILVWFCAASGVAIAFFWWGIEQQQKVTKGLLAYPMVIPRGDGDTSEMLIWNKGDSILSGVKLHFFCAGLSSSERTIDVGTIAGHSWTSVDATLNHKACIDAVSALPNSNRLKVDGDLVARWWFDITAQNGKYLEFIFWRKRGDCPHWSRRWYITLLPKGDEEHPNVWKSLEGFPNDFAQDKWFNSPDCKR